MARVVQEFVRRTGQSLLAVMVTIAVLVLMAAWWSRTTPSSPAGEARGPAGVTQGVEPAPPVARTVRLAGLTHRMPTRSGGFWQVSGAMLVVGDQGLTIENPVIELERRARPMVRIAARRALLRTGERDLHLSGAVTIMLGPDFDVEAEAVTLMPDGSVRGSGAVRLRSPAGVFEGNGIQIDPVPGRVVMSPGSAGEQVIRSSGWGQDLSELGESYRAWAGASPAGEDAVLAAEER